MEYTLSELSTMTGLTLSHLSQLIKRGILPEGEKRGRHRYLPAAEALDILANHQPKKHWNVSNVVVLQNAKSEEIDWSAII